MNKKILAVFLLLNQLALAQSPAVKLTSYVDPFIGTAAHGHVFMGANVPFGAVQLGPSNSSSGWDWCSGYHYSDNTIVGFAHTHLSGTGIGDLGDILIMPVTGTVTVKRGTKANPETGYLSTFSHANETAKAGYYSVLLDRYNIKAELTATERVGIHSYTFPTVSDQQVILDLQEGIGWDGTVETKIEQLNDSTIAGYRNSKGWANDQRVYFTAFFSSKIASITLYNDQGKQEGKSLTAKNTKALIQFKNSNSKILSVKVGISPVSEQNAAANIRAEAPHWNFQTYRKAADAAWEKELRKIQIRSSDQTKLRTFYTALYHTMIAPSLFNDANGDYRGTDKKVYSGAKFNNLTTFSLWDTYRAAHPLFTLIQPEKVNDMVNSMLAIYQQQGKLPVWHLMGNETNTMVGNPAIPVIADAYLKGFNGFDRDLAYEAMKKSAMLDERGLKYIKTHGFIPADSTNESVAMGLEYAIADWSLGQVAKQRKNETDYQYFNKRGHYFSNYFDQSTDFMRGKVNMAEWRTPFNPLESKHRKDDFCEGNAWQYTWLVPQDPEALIKLHGGESAFTKKLDSLFEISGHMGEEASSDISGLIGQYAHGNEPSHHITYLYAFAGQPWKTATKVRQILTTLYTDKTDGLPGNEDVGQMSAWYVLSSLGFYPVNPANGVFVFGSPAMDAAKIQVGAGKAFAISVLNNTQANPYIASMSLNGKPYNKSYITYKDLQAGGKLEIQMGSKPSLTWGVKPQDRPYSELP